LTTLGTLTLGSASAFATEFLNGATLDNAGSATLAVENGNTSYGLNLQNSALFDNLPGASFTFQTDAEIYSNGSSSATFKNEGTLTKTGGTAISPVSAIFNQTGTGSLQVQSGTLQLTGSGTFAGTVQATGGGSFTMTTAPTNLSSGTLTGAIWLVGSNSSMSLGANITTDAATIILNGTGDSFGSLSKLAKVAAGANLQVLGGTSLATTANLDNAGTVDLAPGSWNITGNYTQEATGALNVGVGGLAAGSQFGQLNVSGQAALNGALNISLLNGYSPPSGDSYRILTFGSRTGDFAVETGLYLGAGEGFSPTYDSSGLNLVVIPEEAGTTTTVDSSLSPSTYGQAVTFTATVAPTLSTSLIPTGTVTFYDGTTAIDTETLAGGTATFTTSSLALGNHSISAGYGGDTDFTTSTSATFTVSINPVPPPAAGNQSVTVGEGLSRAITLSSSDPNGDPLAFTLTTPPTAGQLTGSGANVTYTPGSGFSGNDSFQFTVTDTTTGLTSVGVVSITVVPPPTASNQSVTATENSAQSITLTSTDPNADPLTYTITSPPADGRLSGSGANLIYTPTSGYFGSDSFLFTATDAATGLVSAAGTVSINVVPVADLVVGMVSAPSSVVLGQPVTVAWTDVNQGATAATGPWVDRIYLYTSPTDTSPVLVASVPFSGTLGADQTTSLSATVNIPANQPGSFYFGVTTDYFHQVNEGNTARQNSTISAQATVISAPDLAAEWVTTPATGQFGQPITVTWTVTNQGSAPATGSWDDQLYVSSQPTLNGNAVLLTTQDEGAFAPLAAGASYSATAQVVLPLSADMSAGQYYVITVVNADQTLAEATTSNNQAASPAIDISLPALPALAVSGLAPGTYQVVAGQSLNVSWTVTNNGTATANGPWNDEVFLASDAQGDNETLLGTFANGSALAPGASYTSNESVVLPTQAAGQGRLVVVADPAGSVLEPGTGQNRSEIDSVPLTFVTDVVTAQTTVQIANAGTPIPFTGSATNPATGQPVPNAPVVVQIFTSGTTRSISATTDANGNFTATFEPLPTETGVYQYAAGPPADTSDTPQGSFEIVGMTVTSEPTLNLAPGVPLSGSATITNLGSIPLTGLSAEVLNAPANITVQVSLGATMLAASGSVGVTFAVTASDASLSSANVVVELQSVEGAVTDLILPITVAPLVPVLAAQPGTLVDGMLVGSQTLVNFNVVNNGGAASGPLQILVPQASFLSLSSPATIPSLAPGQSTTVTLQLLPEADLPLGSYTGTISLLGTTVSLNVPFQFTAVSSATGNVVIDAEDEMTLESEGSPMVAGASVITSDPQTGDAVASGTTGSDGTLELDQLPIGTYNVTVQADGHNPYQGAVTIQPGLTATVDAFMTNQLVSYQFDVTPTAIPDVYTFTVNTTFTTHVPAPVVTVSPAYIDFNTLTAATTQIDFTYTNNGLIAADNVTLHFDSNYQYQVTPLVNEIGTIPAGSSVTVPVTIQRIPTATSYNPVSYYTEQALDLQAPAAANPPPFSGGDPANYYFNANGGQEKYLVSGNGSNPAGSGYYFVLPNGNLYAWDGNSLVTSEAAGPLVTLNGNVYADPTQLINDPPGSSGDCGGAYVAWSFFCGGQNVGNTTSISYVNFGCPGVADGVPEFASDVPVGSGSGSGGGGTTLPPSGQVGGDVSYSSAAETDVLGLNECDPEVQRKYKKALGYELIAIGAVLLWPPAGVGVSLFAVGGALLSTADALSDPPPNYPTSLQNALLQLETESERLQSIDNVFTDFFGSTDWTSLTNSNDAATEQAWLLAFFQDAVDANGNPQLIGSSEQNELLALPIPSGVTTADAANLISRWNNTINYNAAGIVNLADVPPGQSTNFMARDVVLADLLAAQNGLTAMENEGYTAVGATDLDYDLGQALVNVLNGKPINWKSMTSAPETGLADAAMAAANAAIDAFQQANDTGVCAAVQLQLNQQATVVRSAFQATFTLDNQKPADTLQNIAVNLDVHDMSGNDVTNQFVISTPTLSGLTAVDGTGTLAPDSSGTAGWTIIPTDAAAASGITSYLVEGTLSYVDDGYDVTVPILPTKITVYPGPNLQVQYFLQQNVYGDDPFSTQVTTPQPFALGLLVSNTGAGNAGDFTITSSQPQIIDNQKGLLVNFNIIGAQVGNQPTAPSLTADLGTIASGQTVEADWQMTSSLDGTFSNMNATYQHTDALGGTQTSIISSVAIHDMVQMVQPDEPGDGDNNAPAFLVDSEPSASALPDTLYFADGTTAPVTIATNAAVDGTVTPDNLEIHLTATMTSGWDYLDLPDPSPGFTLEKVVRSDGTQILVGSNAWQTRPVDAGTNDLSADLLHLLDYDGTGSYTLYYLPVGAQPPAVVALTPVTPNPAIGPVSLIDVTLSEAVDPSTFNPASVSLTLNGGPNLINSGVTFTQVSGATYQIGGLAPLTAANGVYQFTVLPGVFQDSAGELSTGTLSEKWANGEVGPYVVQVDSVTPNPRNTPVDSIDVEFDEPIDPSTFDDNALSLTLNGGPNLIDSGVTVSQVSDTTYEISGLSGLTATDGTYVLTVNAAGITDEAGQNGIGSASRSWTMDTAPVTVSLQAVTQSPRSIIVPSLDVTFSAPIDPATFTTQDITFAKSGGPNLVSANTTITELSPTTFQVSGFNNFIYPVDGTYTFTVSAAGVQDLAGNSGVGTTSDTWVMDTTPPDPATNLAITPSAGVSASGTVLTNTGNVTLTGTVDQTGLLLDVYDGATEVITDAPITGESISAGLTLSSGLHDLRVHVVDAAAGVSPDSLLDVLIDPIAPTVTIAPIAPNARATPVNDVTITFSKPVYGFTLANLQLTSNSGPNLLLSGSPTLTSTDQVTWTLGNLSSLTGTNGTYTLTLSPGGIEDGAGNALAAGASVSFTVDTTPVVSFASAAETVSENAGSFSIAVNLSAAAGADVTIPFTLGGTAIAGTDYRGVSTSPLVIPAGQTSATITGTLIDFGADDVLRTLTFTLGTPTYATLGATTTNTLTIAEVPVITWANPVEITYGTPLSASQLDATANLTGTFAYALAAGTILSAGNNQTLTVTFTPTNTADYAVDYTTATATVTINVLQATPTISWANPANIVYGMALSQTQLDATANVPGTFTYTPTAGTVLGAGNNQMLSVLFTPTDTTDYTTASVTATINVLQATPTISWANPANVVYGTALSGTQLDATSSWTVGGESGSVAGTFTYTPAAGTVLAAGNNQTLSVAFTPTDTTDYTTASATAMINVLQATPTISWSNPANVVYGTALSGTQLDATSSWTVGGESGSVAGTFTYTPAAGTVLGAGNNQTLSVAFTPTDTTDYTAASATATINVLQATTTTVATSVNPSVYGQSVTFTATVAAVAPGSGAPTGLVTFDDGTTVLGTGTLNGGVATFSTSSLSVATHSITAVYGGDGNFTTSTSSALSQAVNQDPTSTALSSSVNPSLYGQSVTFTATVTANAPGSGTPSGSVIFMDGTSTLGTGTLNASSAATFTTSALSVASHPITAVYGGDTNDLISTSEPLSQVVNTDTTTTTLTSSVNPSVFRQPVTFTAAVTVVSPGAGTPSGTVTFMDGSTTLGTSSLNGSGVATFSITSLSVATHSITAAYGGDGNFTASTSSAVIQTVNQASTTTSLTASPTSTTSGQPVTLTATIAVVAPGAGTPTGSVQFFVGTTSLGTISLSGNTAILTTTTLPVGTDSLTAQYLGDPNFTGSTSSAVSVTIAGGFVGIATTTTLTSSTNPSVFGQSVTLTATVKPSSGSGTPTGSVTFYAGSTPLGIATLSGKKASLKTASVPIGSQAITAIYSGDTTYAPSKSAVLTQTVNQDSTTTKVTSSANPSVYGQSVTLTATVKAAAPGSGTPTGTVTFYDGTTNLGSGTLSAGTATFTTTFFVVSSHSITAVYSGDPDFTASTSPALSQTVNQAGTTTVVVSAVNPTVYGQPLTYTATVSANSPGSGTPTGTITFYAGSTQLGTGALSGGTASLTTSSLLAVGSHTIKASYGGDTNFKTSAGTLTQTVNQDSTTTSVVSSANPSVFGQSVTFTATVTANAPGSGTPTGSVTFLSGTTTLGTVALSGGTASYSTAKLATSLDTITATYNGSTSFTTSSASLNQTVNQDATSATVTSSLNPSSYGQAVTFTAIVSAASPGSGTPTGTVTFKDGSTTLNTATLNASGKATFKTSALLAGSHSITVVYSGDANFQTSTSSAIDQTVNQAGTGSALASSTDSSTSGQAVTVAATINVSPPGSGSPTGAVALYDGSRSIGTGAVSGGIATSTTSSLSIGSRSTKAVYGGDTNFKTRTSAALTQVVNGSVPGVLVAGSSNPVDNALAALQDEEPTFALIESLAMEQVSSRNRGPQRGMQG